MHIKIGKTVLFLIAAVFCFGSGITSATEIRELDVSVSHIAKTTHTPVVNKGLYLNGSELEAYQSQATCSDDRPCQNGGTCGWYKLCDCPYGIRGDFCEEIVACSSMCQNRLEVDCLYYADARIVYCSCKNSSLYYNEEADICKPCSCENGYCDYQYGYSNRKLVCRCPRGYKEFNGYCKECDCGTGRCQFDSNGGKICNCFDGSFEKEGRCLACECISPSDQDTKCEVTDNVKHCFCPEGYKEVDGLCEEINLCETNNTCHPSTKCYNRYRDIECECPEGYQGKLGKLVQPGEICEDIDECLDLTHACWYPNRANCINLPGSYRCECMPGYRPDSYQQETQRVYCIQTSKSVIPSVIVTFTAFGMLIVSCCVHRRVTLRATRGN